MSSLELCERIPATEVDQTFVCLSGQAGVLAPRFISSGASIETIHLRWHFAQVSS